MVGSQRKLSFHNAARLPNWFWDIQWWESAGIMITFEADRRESLSKEINVWATASGATRTKDW